MSLGQDVNMKGLSPLIHIAREFILITFIISI